MTAMPRALRIIVFQEDDWLCAQLVDYDLAAQAETLEGLYKAIDKMIRAHILVREKHGLIPFSDLPPAPDKFRVMFERSKIALPTQIIAATANGAARPFEVPAEVPAEVRIAAA
jgi:hypothetical protein